MLEQYGDWSRRILSGTSFFKTQKDNVFVASFSFSRDQSRFLFQPQDLGVPGTSYCIGDSCALNTSSATPLDFDDQEIMLLPAAGTESTEVTFTVYRKALLFVSGSPNGVSTTSNSSNSSTYINSVVVAAKVGETAFSGEVRITLRKTDTSQDPVHDFCVFWDYDDGKSTGRWSSSGCRVEDATLTLVTCVCSHLTNFAVLTDTTQQRSVSSEDKLALKVITYVGVALSVPCLLVTFGIHLYLVLFKQKYRIARIVLMHLCANLCVALLIFVFGVEATEHETQCTGVAVLLHYFLLTTFCWMLVEGWHLYRTFIRVFNVDNAAYHTIYALFAYLVPLFIVIVTLAADGSKG